jgi:hypothetical protein
LQENEQMSVLVGRENRLTRIPEWCALAFWRNCQQDHSGNSLGFSRLSLWFASVAGVAVVLVGAAGLAELSPSGTWRARTDGKTLRRMGSMRHNECNTFFDGYYFAAC